MNITLQRSALLRLITTCHGLATTKSAMPMLDNVLLTAAVDGTLRMTSTDLRHWVTVAEGGECSVAGSFATDANRLAWLTMVLPDGPVCIERRVDGTAFLSAVGTARRFSLEAVEAGEYPKAVEWKPAWKPVDLPRASLSHLLARSAFSVSRDETRPHVNSLLLLWEGSEIKAIATDGCRLSVVRMAGSPKTAKPMRLLLPLDAVEELQTMMTNAPVECAAVRMTRGKERARFEVGAATLDAKLTDAEFPPWEKVYPDAWKIRMVAPRLALIDAVRAIATADESGGLSARTWTPTTKRSAWRETSRQGSVRMDVKAGILRLSPEHGRSTDEIHVDHIGPDHVTGFAALYLLDALRSHDSAEVVIEGNEGLSPIRITALDDDDAECVVMPMRI